MVFVPSISSLEAILQTAYDIWPVWYLLDPIYFAAAWWRAFQAVAKTAVLLQPETPVGQDCWEMIHGERWQAMVNHKGKAYCAARNQCTCVELRPFGRTLTQKTLVSVFENTLNITIDPRKPVLTGD